MSEKIPHGEMFNMQADHDSTIKDQAKIVGDKVLKIIYDYSESDSDEAQDKFCSQIDEIIKEIGVNIIPIVLELKIGEEDIEVVFFRIEEAVKSGIIKKSDLTVHVPKLFDVMVDRFEGWSEPLGKLFCDRLSGEESDEKIDLSIQNYLTGRIHRSESSKEIDEQQEEGMKVIEVLNVLPNHQENFFKGKDGLKLLKKWIDNPEMFDYSWRFAVYENALDFFKDEKLIELVAKIFESMIVNGVSQGDLCLKIGSLKLKKDILMDVLNGLQKKYPHLRENIVDVGFKVDSDFNVEDLNEVDVEVENEMTQYANSVKKRLSKPGYKIELFKNENLIKQLPDAEAWVSVRTSEEARELYNAALGLLGERERNQLQKMISQYIKVKKPGNDHFTFCADEIIDAVYEYGQSRIELKQNPQWNELIERMGLKDDVSLRYIKRTESDMRLGDKCGDCTAHGSINYENSLSWLINPCYQILVMKDKGQFMGKICLALGKVKNKNAIFIDAIEFNPQATEGKPFYDRAQGAFAKALEFAKGLATKERANLYALHRSNSSGAVSVLENEGEPLKEELTPVRSFKKDLGTGEDINETFTVQLEVPKETAQFIDDSKAKLWYQMFDEKVIETEFKEKERDLIDERLTELESDVINPAQIASEEIAEAMRRRDFLKAAKIIMKNKEWAEKVNKFFKAGQYSISPVLLAKKIEKMFTNQGEDVRQAVAGIVLKPESFSRLV